MLTNWTILGRTQYKRTLDIENNVNNYLMFGIIEGDDFLFELLNFFNINVIDEHKLYGTLSGQTFYLMTRLLMNILCKLPLFLGLGKT